MKGDEVEMEYSLSRFVMAWRCNDCGIIMHNLVEIPGGYAKIQDYYNCCPKCGAQLDEYEEVYGQWIYKELPKSRHYWWQFWRPNKQKNKEIVGFKERGKNGLLFNGSSITLPDQQQ